MSFAFDKKRSIIKNREETRARLVGMKKVARCNTEKHMRLSLPQHYFDGNVRRGFVSLFTAHIITMIAGGLLGIFLPIFLFTLFDNSLEYTVAYFGVASLSYVLAVAWGMRFLNRFGFHRALITSVFFGAAFYAIFNFMEPNTARVFVPLSLAALLFYRMLYWVPYHVNFAKFTDRKNRAREMSVLIAASQTIGVFIPIIAGLIITRFSFDVLFVLAMMLFLVSGIPYLTIPRTNESFGWSYRETWRQFFSRERRAHVLAFGALGAESIVGLTVWPIFLFTLFHGNYFTVGAVSTLIIGVTVILQLALGKHIDRRVSGEKIMRMGSAGYAVGWILKMFVATAFHVFIVGAYHSIARIFLNTPFSALTYDIAADQGHYVDEFTVIREMAINLGKALMVTAIIAVSSFAAIQWTFVLAAASAVLLNLLHAEYAPHRQPLSPL